MSSPAFSVVIPGFNRIEPLKFTLRSAVAAAERLPGEVEIILVDDGSSPALDDSLKSFSLGRPVIHLRQPNQGSIVARQTGLARATGDCVLFLDSDDLIHPEKLAAHWQAQQDEPVDLIYDDMALAHLGADYSASYSPGPTLAPTADSLELLLRVQPAPHGPSYRRSWLLAALKHPLVPARRPMDPAGDVWLYYNLLPSAARIRKLPLPLTAAGPHEDVRYSQHWEKLGAAALLIAEAFMARCPAGPSNEAARRAVGEAAFHSWRRLPRDFHAGYTRRLLAIWRAAPHGPSHRLGGAGFAALANVLGPELAGKILRRRNPAYATCRTLDDSQVEHLFAAGRRSGDA